LQVARTPAAHAHHPAAYAAGVVQVITGQVPDLQEGGAGDLIGQVGVAEAVQRRLVDGGPQYGEQRGQCGRIPAGDHRNQSPQDVLAGEVDDGGVGHGALLGSQGWRVMRSILGARTQAGPPD